MSNSVTTVNLSELVRGDPEILRIAREDPIQIIENFFFIVDKNNKKVPFRLNEAQLKYYENMTARDDILKARKEGFSSLILAILTVRFLFLENMNCVCISHETEATQKLFKKVKYYIENMEDHLGRKIVVDTMLPGSRKRLDRKCSSGGFSSFYIGTAGAKAFGRGDDIHQLHCSEVAFWQNASEVLTGLMQAVPDNLDNTYIVKESTANGYGTQHQKEWENEETGLSVFKPHFFGWHLDPVNKMDLGVYQAQMGESFFANQEEIKMSIEHNLIDEQLAWRRWKIKAMQPSDIYTKHELFRQEFPITAREAFISSGKSIFSEDTIKWVEELCVMEPKLLGDLVGFDTPLFEKSVEGFLSIWEEPSPNGLYCLAGDVAEVHDYCYLVVGDKRTGRQVAEWRGRVDEFELALIAYRLGMYYNKALIGIERNNHGVAVVKKLDELAYANQYVRRTIDETYETYHNELGWRTDQATRPIMISDLNQSITNRTFIPRSAVVPSEMRTFVRKNKTGRAEAQPNCHDDAIIGNSILVQLFKHVAEPVKDEDIVTRGYVPNNSLYNYTKRR